MKLEDSIAKDIIYTLEWSETQLIDPPNLDSLYIDSEPPARRETDPQTKEELPRTFYSNMTIEKDNDDFYARLGDL